MIDPNLEYPPFSDILFSSKSGPLTRAPYISIENGRKEQLKILSNFYANYLRNLSIPLNYDVIIPVPAKPEYSFNSIEIICQEFNNVFNIPIELGLIERTSDHAKSYEFIDRSINLSNTEILLIDDIITDGITRDFICSRLYERGCNNICAITLGRTDHFLYR